MDDIAEIKESLRHNIASVQERIERTCARCSRRPSEVRLVAASKTVAAARVALAYELGLRDFGENRVQEAEEKISVLPAEVTWHLIGHLQTNKVKRAVQLFDFIQSVDSARIARAISLSAAAIGKETPILVEVNVAGEATKTGLALGEVMSAVEEIVGLPALRLQGLMTVAPIVECADQARPYFATLRKLRDELRVRYPSIGWDELSMGMTDDFEAAIEEGATIVRVGRAIFGARTA